MSWAGKEGFAADLLNTESFTMGTEGYAMNTKDYTICTGGYPMNRESYPMYREGYSMKPAKRSRFEAEIPPLRGNVKKKHIQTRNIVVLLIIIILTLGPFASTALAGVFDLMPPRPTGAGAYLTTPNYEKFSITAYIFDYKDFFSESPNKLVMTATNTLLLIKAWLIKLSIRVMEYALNGDLLLPLTQTATDALNALRQWLWESDGAPLVVAALAFTALCSLIAVLARRLTRSIQMLAGTALVLIASYAVLTAAPGVLAGLCEITRAASTQSMDIIASVSQAGTGEDLIIRAGEEGWSTFVYLPWLDGEFNDRAAAAQYSSSGLAGGTILGMKLDERPKIYTDRLPAVGGAVHPDFQLWRSEFMEWRVLLTLFTLLTGAGYAVALLLLSGGIIFYQLVLLIAVALLPVWLLMALWWPQGSIRVFKHVLATALGALLRQVVLAITLAVVLVLTLALKLFLPDSGWVLPALLYALLALAAYRYRFAWLPALAAPFTVRIEKSAGEMNKKERSERAVFVPVTYTEERRAEGETREMAAATIQLPRWSEETREMAAHPVRPLWSSGTGVAEFRREMMALRQR